METTQVEREGAAMVTTSTTLTVVDAPSYGLAADFLLGIKQYRAKVAEICDPVVEAAHAAHKAAVAQRKTLDAPADEAERAIKGKMLAWKQAEDARQAEIARQAEAAQRKAAEDAALAEAAAAEQAGAHAEAAAIIERPMFVAPVYAAPAAPKVAGITTRKEWDFEITDAARVPRQFLMVDETKLRKYVKAMGAQAAMDGVRIFQRETVAASRR